MLPTIPYKCEIIVSPIRSIEIGKIYIYLDEDIESKAKFVCHRLVESSGESFWFKGDNRSIKDMPIPKEKILWEYEEWINADYTN